VEVFREKVVGVDMNGEESRAAAVVYTFARGKRPSVEETELQVSQRECPDDK
jgi:hypothetical protein